MDRTHSTHASSRSQAKADDFRVINGIGEGIENRLHNAGILTYAQLASLSPDELLSSMGKMIGLTRERIVKQDWIGQAQELAANPLDITEDQQGEDETNGHLHYEVFTVELLLDEGNFVRRTRAIHVQSQQEKTWAGWEADRLIRLFTSLAQVHTSSIEEMPDHSAVEDSETGDLETWLKGDLRISEIRIAPDNREMINSNEPFTITLSLDLSDLDASPGVLLAYSAVINAKSLSDGLRRTVGTAEGTFILPEEKKCPIHVDIPGLPEGLYRTEVIVTLKLAEREEEQHGELKAMSEGNLLLVS
jgi:hypothetical protein